MGGTYTFPYSTKGVHYSWWLCCVWAFMACRVAHGCDTSPTKLMTNGKVADIVSQGLFACYVLIVKFITKHHQVYIPTLSVYVFLNMYGCTQATIILFLLY